MSKTATVGNFDGCHRGHRAVLNTLLREGHDRNEQTLVITFSNHPLSVIAPERAPSALSTPDDKLTRLRRAADQCIMLQFTPELCRLTAREWMQRLRDEYDVRTLVLGYDNTFGSDGRQMSQQDYLRLGKEMGVDIVIVPALHDYSSTGVRKAVSKGDMPRAAKILGRYYSLRGRVSHGDRIGSSIGIPTANLQPAEGLMIPPGGVYAGYVRIPDGEYRQAVINIGHRPTLEDKYTHSLRIEAHIPGWEGDLYDSETEILFVTRIRDELTFDSLDALKDQIHSDIDTMREVLRAHPAMTVIIPVYNGEKYLSDTIHSLLCQTAPDWEVIMVDDSSTDNSFSIIGKAAESDSRIRVYRKENQGFACYGIVYALQRANGEYMQYMSQDDMLSPDLLERALEIIETEDDIDAVLPQMRSWDRAVQHPGEGKLYNSPEAGAVITGREAFELSVNWMIHGFALVRMALVKDLGFETAYLASDEYETRRQYLACRKIGISSGEFYYHTGNPDAISRKWRPALTDIIECDARLLALAVENKADTPQVRIEIGRRLADGALGIYDIARAANAPQEEIDRIKRLIVRTEKIWNIKGVSRRMRLRLLMISKIFTILHPKCI
ncbi:MAG: riboflavin biosynthesis protein RibF [Muribaculaceae bacterium]|nr:riboflavin biosynthesis protein RibF [Muribaculaceae bacterium]